MTSAKITPMSRHLLTTAALICFFTVLIVATTELPFSGSSNYGLVVLSDPDDACAGIPGDIDGSGDVSFADLLAVLANWGPCVGCPADVNGDGIVDFADLLVVLANWT